MFWKRLLLSLLAIVVTLTLTVAITLNFIATPERLTPKLVEIAQRSILSEISIKRVDYTLFSNFPNITLEIDSLRIAQSKDSISDLLSARHCELAINPFALLGRRVVIENLLLDKPEIYMYVDGEHRPINHFILEETEPQEQSDTLEGGFDLSQYQMVVKRFKIDSAQITIDDRTRKVYSRVSNLGVDLKMGVSLSRSRARFDMGFDNLLVWKSGDVLVKRTSMGLSSKLSFNRDSMMVSFKDAEFRLNNIELKADGRLRSDSLLSSVAVDIRSSLNTPSLGEFLALVPNRYIDEKEKISTSGSVALDIDVSGEYSSTSMPIVDARLKIEDGTARYGSKKISLERVLCDAEMHLDMNSPKSSYANIKNFSLSSSDILNLSLSGKVSNIIDSPQVNIHLKERVDLDRITDIFPLQDGVEVSGVNSSDISAIFSLSDLTNGNFAKLYLEGESTFERVGISVDGSKFLQDSTSQAFLDMTIEQGKLLFGDRVREDDSRTLLATINCSGLGYLSKAGESLSVSNLTLTAGANFDTKTSQINGLGIRGVAENTSAGVADLFSAAFESSDMTFTISPKNDERNTVVKAIISSTKIVAEEHSNNSKLNLSTVAMELDMAKIETRRWDVNGNVTFEDFNMFTDMFPIDITIPKSRVKVNNKSITLNNTLLGMGRSRLTATGNIDNLLQKLLIEPRTALSGSLKINSTIIDANELMAAATNSSLLAESDDYNDETEEEIEEITPTLGSDSLPQPQLLRVPRNTDFAFDLNINRIIFEESEIEKLVGRATVKDGVLSLDELSLIAIGAEATGSISYRNIGRNSANVDLSLSLSQVDINRIGELSPSISSMLPMLESFEGVVDFNLSANSNIKGDYEFDINTLKGAISFRGVNLVLMDSETFNDLSKMLMFKNKDRNLIESIEAYALIDQSKIDLLPFEISIDRYKAILGGTQSVDPTTFDIDFDYNVSIVKSPLPFKAGVDLYGDLSDFDFKITKAKLKDTNMDEQRERYEAYRATIIPAKMERVAKSGEDRSKRRQQRDVELIERQSEDADESSEEIEITDNTIEEPSKDSL